MIFGDNKTNKRIENLEAMVAELISVVNAQANMIEQIESTTPQRESIGFKPSYMKQ